MRRMCLVL